MELRDRVRNVANSSVRADIWWRSRSNGTVKTHLYVRLKYICVLDVSIFVSIL